MEKPAHNFAADTSVADAKERRRRTEARSLPKRFNASVLLGNTSIPCLTRIAENSSVPASMLEQLAMHNNPCIREAVADNINTPIDSLWLLSLDECCDIRYAMAENHNLPLAILDSLSQDNNPYVAHRAQRTLDRLLGGLLVMGQFEAESENRRFSSG
jgi:hypothetical protein